MPSSRTNDALSQLTPFALFLAFAGTFGLLAWYFLWPAYMQLLPGGSLNYQTQLDELNSNKAYLTDLRSFKSLYDVSQGETADKLSAMVPQGRSTPSLFAMHEALAKQRGLVLNAIDIVSPTGSGSRAGLNDLSVSLKLSGARYPVFKQYIKDLENLLRITEVDSMGFDARGGTINLNLRTFHTGNE